MIEAVGPLAILANTIFQWVTEPEGYHELKIDRKLEKLHDACIKALNARDFAALDALSAEYRRLRETII